MPLSPALLQGEDRAVDGDLAGRRHGPLGGEGGARGDVSTVQ